MGNISAEDVKGMFLEVDLNYPKHLHKSHNDFALTPNKMHIAYKHLPVTQKRQLPHGKHTAEKLVHIFFDWKNDVIHSHNLVFLINQGLIPSAIHLVSCVSERESLHEAIRRPQHIEEETSQEPF